MPITLDGELSLNMVFDGDLSTDIVFEGELGTYIEVSAQQYDTYTGSYEVTPSAETQTLATANKVLTEDIVVNPIPSNYGLITYNGSFITVS